MIKHLAVFLGSRDGNDPTLGELAYEVGQGLAERDIELVYGAGGGGLMGQISQGAIDGNGKVFGVIPRFMVEREWGRVEGAPGMQTVVVDTMHERKAMMAERAEAFLALPGGIGTLEELFEVWTWQTLSLHGKPVGLLNVNGFWDPLVEMMERIAEAGFLHGSPAETLVVGDDLDDVLARLDAAR